MHHITGKDRNEICLPTKLEDLIEEENPIRVIDTFIDEIDFNELSFVHATVNKKGRPPYNPKDIMKLYIYGYLNGIRSSRKLEKEVIRNFELIWLLKTLRPDYKTISDFRKNNEKSIAKLFNAFRDKCIELNLYGAKVIAIDGTKFRANNSKKNNFSLKKIENKLKSIDKKLENYFKELDENDESESDEIPFDNERVAEFLNKIQEEKKKKIKFEGYKKQLDETGEKELSTVDPDARLMCNNNGSVIVAYNGQASVDSKNNMVIDWETTSNPNDQGQLWKMSLRSKEILDQEKITVLADKGYYQENDLKLCEEDNIIALVSKQVFANSTGEVEYYKDKFKYLPEEDAYQCPQNVKLIRLNSRKQNGEVIGYNYGNKIECKDCPVKDKCTKDKRGRRIYRKINQDVLDRVDERTSENKELYKKRQTIVEPVFGTIKRAHNSDYLLVKGFDMVNCEMSLFFLCYNLKRAINILGVSKLLKELSKKENKVA